MDVNAQALLDTAELTVVGRLVDASNATLLCSINEEIRVIYKPIAGERPLWDFPDGDLASREVAAYYISKVGDFDLVPYTTLRDGPFGKGSVQHWIDNDESIDIAVYGQSDDLQLRALALFDAVLNNTDRKFGHLLLTKEGKLFGCDHGVTLHTDPKLRTVLWQWSGDALTPQEIEQLRNLRSVLDTQYLGQLISAAEIDALTSRIDELIRIQRMPTPSDEWPAVPWPPF
ncbi:MAG: phosphatidylinositol kinase [Actinobacteria bacterium]|nr:phosphatidylinositol kinase [Actinomycetota bacterium]